MQYLWGKREIWLFESTRPVRLTLLYNKNLSVLVYVEVFCIMKTTR